MEAAEALERSNETLERRVQERTEELTRLNAALARAKGEADAANISKTKFLAAASHDILQPLNAARLYVTSLIERQGGREDARLVGNIDASLEAVEEIFGALLDMSRLDTGAMRPEFASFRIDELMRQIELEFAPLAGARGSNSNSCRCSLVVRSDRRLLRRLIQNLVSNAIKYTPSGRVLVGCRRRGENLRVDVYDTGIGIPESKQRDIFVEFHRLDQGARIARGLGLGLSIVERVARVLGCAVEVDSTVGRGSRFSVLVPRSSAVPIELPQRDDARRRSRPTRRHHGAVHRQRAGGARRHGNAAARLGLRGDQGAGLKARAGGDRAKARPCRTGCWSTTISTRATALRRSCVAPRAWRRPAGDPDYRRPLAGGARGRRARRHPGAEQAAQAGGAARACWRNGACCGWRRRNNLFLSLPACGARAANEASRVGYLRISRPHPIALRAIDPPLKGRD